MRKFTHEVNQVLAGFCGWLMLAMMILLVIDIISRSVGPAPSKEWPNSRSSS